MNTPSAKRRWLRRWEVIMRWNGEPQIPGEADGSWQSGNRVGGEGGPYFRRHIAERAARRLRGAYGWETRVHRAGSPLP